MNEPREKNKRIENGRLYKVMMSKKKNLKRCEISKQKQWQQQKQKHIIFIYSFTGRFLSTSLCGLLIHAQFSTSLCVDFVPI